MAEINIAPELRFPDFENGIHTQDYLFKLCEVNPINGELPEKFIYIDLESVNAGRLEKENEINKDQAPSRAQRILAFGDILYQTVRPYQRNNYHFKLEGDYVASTGYAQIRNPDCPEYYYQLFHTDKFVNEVLRRCTGTSYPAINSTDLEKILIIVPQPEEQQKIASFLTAVDERIQLLQKKKAKLEEYKKGVMQQLFSQQIRFKDENGNDFPDWEEKRLGEIGEFKTSSVNKKIYDDLPMVYLVNYMNVYRHEIISNANRDSLMQVSATETQLISNNLKKGDILFTPSSETPSDIGHSVVIFEDLENTLYSYHLMRFRPIIEIELMYSHYFCNIPSVLRQISRFATGSTRFTISVDSFSKIKVSIPSLPEQKKIADFLRLIDDSIDSIRKEIEGSAIFKKGLLQKMFV